MAIYLAKLLEPDNKDSVTYARAYSAIVSAVQVDWKAYIGDTYGFFIKFFKNHL